MGNGVVEEEYHDEVGEFVFVLRMGSSSSSYRLQSPHRFSSSLTFSP